MQRFLINLALSPKLLETYRADPALVVGAGEGLTAGEKTALKSGQPGYVHNMMIATQEEVSSSVEKSLSEEELEVGGVELPVVNPIFLVDSRLL